VSKTLEKYRQTMSTQKALSLVCRPQLVLPLLRGREQAGYTEALHGPGSLWVRAM